MHYQTGDHYRDQYIGYSMSCKIGFEILDDTRGLCAIEFGYLEEIGVVVHYN